MVMKPLSKVDCRYGAPMGRHGQTSEIEGGRYYLQRVRLDSGGYDAGGAYWGIGQPLYRWSHENDDECSYLRANSRDDAKAQIRDVVPNARFFN